MNSLWSSKSTGLTYIHKYAYVFHLYTCLVLKITASIENTQVQGRYCMHTKHTCLWVLVAHTHVCLLLQGNHPITSFHFIIHYAHYTLVQALNNVKCGQLVSIQHRHTALGANQKQVHFADAAIMVATTEGWTAVCAMWATKATELGQKAAIEGKVHKSQSKGWLAVCEVAHVPWDSASNWYPFNDYCQFQVASLVNIQQAIKTDPIECMRFISYEEIDWSLWFLELHSWDKQPEINSTRVTMPHFSRAVFKTRIDSQLKRRVFLLSINVHNTARWQINEPGLQQSHCIQTQVAHTNHTATPYMECRSQDTRHLSGYTKQYKSDRGFLMEIWPDDLGKSINIAIITVWQSINMYNLFPGVNPQEVIIIKNHNLLHWSQQWGRLYYMHCVYICAKGA